MKNLETTLSPESLYHGHLGISRDRRPQTVVVKGALVIEAVLDNPRQGVEFWLGHFSDGLPISSGVLPFEAFEEILDMIIGFGKRA